HQIRFPFNSFSCHNAEYLHWECLLTHPSHVLPCRRHSRALLSLFRSLLSCLKPATTVQGLAVVSRTTATAVPLNPMAPTSIAKLSPSWSVKSRFRSPKNSTKQLSGCAASASR